MESEVRRYHVIEAVGRGGFGTVYRARLLGPSGFTKQVALKVLNPDAPESIGVAERLRDEARLLGMLRHRAIVQVDGLHLLNGRWTVVMEFVDGADLKQVLGATGPLPPGVAVEIVQEVANALHYAFELSQDMSVSVALPPTADPDRACPTKASLRLLHRDIKPGNIQLTAAGEVKVLDFGVARADFADRESHTQSIYFGSLNYMAPERLDGIDDHKGDIYALGAVLFELLTGQPFGRTSANRERHDSKLREGLNVLWHQHPDEALYRLVAECLLFEPSARPSARELERACRDLRPRLGAPYLSEWAEQSIPEVLTGREALPDELSGATLVEAAAASGGVTSGHIPRVEAGPRKAETVAPTAARPPSRGLAVGVAVLAFLVVVIGGGLAAWRLLPMLDPPAAPAAPAEPRVDTLGVLEEAFPAGEEALAPPVVEEEAPAPVVEPAPPVEERAPAPVVERASAPVAAEPAPPAEDPASQAHGTVRVVRGGSDARVRLQGEGGSLPLGRVPAGTYTIEARFTDGVVDTSVQIEVADGATVQLSCLLSLHRCLAI